jgi:hypothetical protein
VEQLKSYLTFSEWVVAGLTMTIDQILLDHFARAQVLADLQAEMEEAQKRLDMSRQDAMIFAELKVRHDHSASQAAE